MNTGVYDNTFETTFVTGHLVSKINQWSHPDKHWFKREVLTRTVSLVAITTFAGLDALYNGTAATLKFPLMLIKGTVGQIALPKVGKLSDHMSPRIGMAAFIRHAYKTVLFAIDMLIGPALGVINPRSNTAFHEKVRIIRRPIIFIPAVDPFSDGEEAYHFSTKSDPLDLTDGKIEQIFHGDPSQSTPDTLEWSPFDGGDASLSTSIPWPQEDIVEPPTVKEVVEEPAKRSAANKAVNGALWLTNEWFIKPLELMGMET